MLSEFVNVPIRKDDLVKIVGKGTGLSGTLCRVLFVDNTTAIASVQKVGGYGSQDIHVSKLELYDRPMPQLKLF